MSFDYAHWTAQNHQFLVAYITHILALLDPDTDRNNLPEKPNLKNFDSSLPPAIARLSQLFNLTQFEQEILLLCVAAEMERSTSALCATLNGSPQQAFPTFRAAMAVLPEANWQALLPTEPLRQWQLIDVAEGAELTQSALRIDERILHEIMGMSYVDRRLNGILKPLPPNHLNHLATSHQKLASQVTEALDNPKNYIQLCGPEPDTLKQIALSACIDRQAPLFVISAETIPTEIAQAHIIQRLCEREALLTQGILLLACENLAEEGTTAAQQAATVVRWMDTCQVPVIVTQRERRAWGGRTAMTIDVDPPTTPEQQELWQLTLPETQHHQIDRLVATFNLSAQIIQTIAAQSDVASEEELWQSCLEYARPRFDSLAQQIQSTVGWRDVVLPNPEMAVLKTIAAHVKQRSRVYEDWGFGAKSRRGLGISALFAGASGTGKTLSAEVLANELNLDLFRIDISSVVSKYIGETEKNLRRIFDAAESGGAILLFDEADALFGKRSDVKDSHDRYANMEVAYLLQKIEAYRGLAILTTNLKDSIDQAFLRRIRFVVQFPFPDATQRTEIWRRVFPEQTPVQKLAYNKLARLGVAGGNIRNIALNAAFLAADAGEAVSMEHILQSAQSEYVKLERPLTDQEVRGWLTSSSV
jgi:ATPase family associated with various cellular activities (AAA)